VTAACGTNAGFHAHQRHNRKLRAAGLPAEAIDERCREANRVYQKSIEHPTRNTRIRYMTRRQLAEIARPGGLVAEPLATAEGICLGDPETGLALCGAQGRTPTRAELRAPGEIHPACRQVLNRPSPEREKVRHQ
jgi:hypothetical protein